MKTEIFKNYEEFKKRKNKKINGVDNRYYTSENYDLEEDTGNTGCWNCSDCTNCKNCISCFQCSNCVKCESCSDCKLCDRCKESYWLVKCINCTDLSKSTFYKKNKPFIG